MDLLPPPEAVKRWAYGLRGVVVSTGVEVNEAFRSVKTLLHEFLLWVLKAVVWDRELFTININPETVLIHVDSI